jgi:uncharacterized protein YebE (UPF0316 family)
MYLSKDSKKEYCKHIETYNYLKANKTSLENILHNLNLFEKIDNIDKIQELILSKKEYEKCKN